jgi:hypothetical protein
VSSKEQLADTLTKPLAGVKSISADNRHSYIAEADPCRKDKFKVNNQSSWDKQG